MAEGEVKEINVLRLSRFLQGTATKCPIDSTGVPCEYRVQNQRPLPPPDMRVVGVRVVIIRHAQLNVYLLFN